MNLTSSEFRRGGHRLRRISHPVQFHRPVHPATLRGVRLGRGDIQLALFCYTVAVVLTVPFIGALADRFGVRRVAIFALADFGISFAALAFTPASLPGFYLLWA